MVYGRPLGLLLIVEGTSCFMRCSWIVIIDVCGLICHNAFGHHMPPLAKQTPKWLHCRDPRLVDNYISRFCSQATKCDLYSRVEQLYKCSPLVSTLQVAKEYEILDDLRCQVVAQSESKCRKLNMGQVAFSPELNACRLGIRAWTLVISRLQGKNVSSWLISRALKKANLDSTFRGFSEA